MSLGRRERLTDESRNTLRSLTVRVRDFRSNEDLVRAGTRPHESCLVISGFAARAQYLPSGRSADRDRALGGGSVANACYASLRT